MIAAELEYRSSPVEAVDVAGRTVTVRLCRWSTPTPVVDRDGTRYREEYPPGSVDLAGDVHVVDRHDGTLIGRADPSTLRDDGDGPVVDLVVARTAAGSDVLALLEANAIRAVSMEIEPVSATRGRDGLITRTRSIVHGIAFAFRPQHDAPVLALREQPGGTMTVIDTPIPDVLTPDPSPPATAVNLVDVATLDRAIDDLRRDVLTRDAGSTPGHPASRFRSLDDFVAAAWDDPALRGLLSRALVDQITTDNPGVVPPGWLSEVFGIVDAGRPTITAFGTAPLPPSGMDLNWPYFDGDLLALVGVQAVEKAPIVSVKVSLKKGTQDLQTFAGGSDLSWQLVRRSSPSYRDAYMRIMFAAYAAVTDNAAADQAYALGSGFQAFDPATGTADTLRAALFGASSKVKQATGSPASFALVASDVFQAVGGLPGLFPSGYGTSNVAGTADAGTLSIDVSNLPIIEEPALAAGTGIVSNGQAGSWHEDGPMSVAAEDVEKLGTNVAVWGMGAFAAYLPAGIVRLAATAPVAAGTRGRKVD